MSEISKKRKFSEEKTSTKRQMDFKSMNAEKIVDLHMKKKLTTADYVRMFNRSAELAPDNIEKHLSVFFKDLYRTNFLFTAEKISECSHLEFRFIQSGMTYLVNRYNERCYFHFEFGNGFFQSPNVYMPVGAGLAILGNSLFNAVSNANTAVGGHWHLLAGQLFRLGLTSITTIRLMEECYGTGRRDSMDINRMAQMLIEFNPPRSESSDVVSDNSDSDVVSNHSDSE